MDKIAQLINNGMVLLGRKIDSLALELRNRKAPETKISVDIGDNVAKGVSDAIKESIGSLKMPEMPMMPEHPPYPAFPEIPAPQVTVNVPEIKLPTINVPETIVNLPAPVVNVAPTSVEFPKEMKVTGITELITAVNDIPEPAKLLDGITNKNPMPVQLVDSKGKPFTANDFGGGGGPSVIELRTGTTKVSSTNPLPITDGFGVDIYDQIVLTYSGSNITTVVYKLAGVTLTTLTLSYTGDNLTGVVKS